MTSKTRTVVSFSVLGTGLVAFMLVWFALNNQPAQDGTPKAFRKVMELNGKIWKSLFSTNRLSQCTPPPKGTIPRVNGDIGLGGEAADWHLEVVADEQNPNAKHLSITLAELKALPRTDTSTEFRCIEGWSEDMAFAGVKFSDFMRAYNLGPHTYVGITSSDGEYYVSMDIESMLHPQTLLAYEMNGEPLRPENGAPLRLVIPVKYGIKNIKHIGRIFFSEVRPPDYWAEQGYDWYAGL